MKVRNHPDQDLPLLRIGLLLTVLTFVLAFAAGCENEWAESEEPQAAGSEATELDGEAIPADPPIASDTSSEIYSPATDTTGTMESVTEDDDAPAEPAPESTGTDVTTTAADSTID